ncbi:MAG: hypothetical protein IKA99_04615 [Clostridia bacterium]|nr:hypothetical protein [Clostridia bacterium]
MKELHLVCNAHLDPVWMWDWTEGASEAISTFYSAVELAEEFDYVFCHNEVLLYEFIEKYDAELFEKIKKLVNSGKWRIMGGWYLQPDVVAPTGESIIRQAYLGKKYFTEKFGVNSTTALNFDSFGHPRGLTQALKVCGYDSYLICRPMEDRFHLEQNPFKWVGYDDSEIKVFRMDGDTIYCSPLGHAEENIRQKLKLLGERDYALVLWGVGNHGGGPSRKDLQDIERMMNEEDYKIIHSYPEAYFEKVDPKFEIKETLGNIFIKCYSSLSRVKRRHAELENALYLTEKMVSVADSIKGASDYTKEFDEAMRDMAFVEFHDILSGTCAEDGERSALKKCDHALEILDNIKLKAFFTLAEDFEKAQEGTFPIFIFNPNPFDFLTSTEAEFLLLDAICDDERKYEITAFVGDKEVPCQVIKELSNINYDRRKRVALKVNLKAMEITRVDLHIKVVPKVLAPMVTPDFIEVKDEFKTVVIDKKKGLITSYKVGDKELIAGDIFVPYIFDDSADPWGFADKTMGTNMRRIPLATGEEDLFKDIESCRITQDGDVLTQVESLFKKEGFEIRLLYKIYKGLPYVDVTCNILYDDKLKGIRLGFENEKSAQVAMTLGRENLTFDYREKPMHRFMRLNSGLTIANDGTFSAVGDETGAYMTLLNGSMYCAHLIGDRPLIDYTRFITPIEIGWHTFNYRIGYVDEGKEESFATAFNQKQFALVFFPHGKGRENSAKWKVPEDITLVACRKVTTGKEVRLFNNSSVEKSINALIDGVNVSLAFGKYELKTVFIKDGKAEICDLAIDLNR